MHASASTMRAPSGPLWAGRARLAGRHARAMRGGAATAAGERVAAPPPPAPFLRHHRHPHPAPMHALPPTTPTSASPKHSSNPTHYQPPSRRRRQEELVAEAAASAPLPEGAPRRDAGFFARRAAMLEALVPGLVEGGNLHALAPREAAELLSRGVGEGGGVCAARLVRLRSAVPSGVDVGELVRRCPKLLMVFEDNEDETGRDGDEGEKEAGLSAESAERATVARLRRLLAFDDQGGGGGNKPASAVETELADLIRAHPELLIPSVGGRRAIGAKMALLERGLAKRWARLLPLSGGEKGDNSDDDQKNDDPTRSAAALVAACPDLLARSESSLAAVLAELSDVDAALCAQPPEGEEQAAAAALAAAAVRLHGRVLAARPALLHHYGCGGRAGRGLVREAVEDAPALLELPSAQVFRDLLWERPGTLLQALLPSSSSSAASLASFSSRQWEAQQPQAQPRADYF